MYNIAIVEDEKESTDVLEQCLNRYSKEKNVSFRITTFKNGAEFVLKYKPIFDVVFMDVDMPKLNGFEAAKKLREVDSEVVLIFVTMLAKYAIRGYEFDAYDYILKPIVYGSLKIKIGKVLKERKKVGNRDIVLPVGNGFLRIDAFSLDYIEISGHNIIYHTNEGNYETYGSLAVIEKVLPKNLFCRCNRCFLVNLRSVFKIEGDYVVIGENRLFIGRTRKKEFLKAMQKYESYEE